MPAGPIVNRYLLSAGWYGWILFFSSIPGRHFPRGVTAIPDAIPHFLEYLVMGILIARLHKATPLAKHFLLSLAILTLLGLLDECYQTLVPDRHFSFIDLLSDMIGGSVSIAWVGFRIKAKISPAL